MKFLTHHTLRLFIILLFIAHCSLFNAFSQEHLTGLNVNPVLKNYQKTETSLKSDKSDKAFATLPFIDDFSGSGPYPNPSLWTDKLVFINNEYPVKPPTIGVATFDALDASGHLYKNANTFQFAADTLSSVPIRLDSFYFKNNQKPISIRPRDSVYLSFFYQPAGLGNAPFPQDSLVLEFYSLKDTVWHEVWSTFGLPLDSDFIAQIPKKDTALYKTEFKKVMVPVRDSADYLRKGFRFRFRSYATVGNDYLSSWDAGNVSIWNIDYVYLDTNRRYNDSTFKDVAFKTNPGNLLKNYRSMPWKQYLANTAGETSSGITYNLHNFNNIIRLTNELFQVYDLPSKVNIYDAYPNGITFNFPALSDSTFQVPLNSFTFQPLAKSKNHDFKVSAFISKSPLDIYFNNDSVSFIQRFNTYFAYDDGNPEKGYGLDGLKGTTGLIAYRFNLNVIPDTLQSLAIFFNSTFQNANQQIFNLIVWDAVPSSDGKDTIPGKIIFESSGDNKPGNNGLDAFKVYPLDSAIIIKNKTFFVGVREFDNGSKDNLNIGFDLNNDNSAKTFYSINGPWIPSINLGSLMIRPVFGSYPGESVNELSSNNYQLTLYPNPVTGNTLNVIFSGANSHTSNIECLLYNSIGQQIQLSTINYQLLANNSQISIPLPSLSDGIYILRLYSQAQNISISKKFIIKKN